MSEPIAIATGVLRRGGVASYIADLACELDRRGLACLVHCPAGEGRDWLAGRIPDGCWADPIGPRGEGLGRACRASPLVLLQTGAFPPDTRLAWRITRRPTIEILHVMPRRKRVKLSRRVFYRLRPTRRYRVVLLNAEDFEYSRGAIPELAGVTRRLRSGMTLPERPEGVEKEAGLVVTAARLDESHKDISTLIRAAAIAQKPVPALRVEVFGDGPDREACQALIEELGAPVKLMGWSDEVDKQIARATVFVLSTKRESFGRVLISAAAMGVPTIASDLPVLRETVDAGVSGLLVAPGDAEALAAAMTDLLTDEGTRAALGSAAPVQAEKFSIGAHTDALLALASEIGVEPG